MTVSWYRITTLFCVLSVLPFLAGCSLFSGGSGAGTKAQPSPTPNPEAAEQGSISYEGQRVASVEIAGKPDANLRELKPLITQPINNPYSQEKVDATISALKKAGASDDIDVNITPEANGLGLQFVLQPAYYFGIFQFPKAVNHFSYTRLLQASNYPRQEPYSPGRVQEAESNLLDFFHQTGYFRATIEPELQTDARNRIVNVTFDIKLRKRAKFGTILITGIPKSQTQRLADSLTGFRARLKGAYLKPGKTYSLKRLQNAITYLQGQLGKQHYLEGSVRMVSAKYDPATNRADVTLHVVQGPKVEIKIAGAHVWGRTQKKLIPMYQENTVDSDLVHEGAQDLTSYFQSKGFFDVKVDSKITQQPNGINILYQVTKGKRGKVAELEYHGNDHFSDKQLESHVALSEAKWWLPFFSHGKFSDQLVQKSAKNLEGLYQSAGYSQVSVTPQVKNQNGKLTVVFEVDEGQRDIVESLQLEGNKSFSEEELAPKGLNLEPGKPYSQDLLNRDRDRIVATYLDHGFLTMAFRARVNQPKNDPHQIQVIYSIDEGPQVYTTSLAQLGAPDTRPEIVARNANIKVGKPLSETTLLQGESNLYTLGIFDWTSVDTRAPITDQSEADVLVKMHEAKKNTITYGVGFEVTNRGGSIPSGTVALPGLPPVGLPENFKTSQQTFWGPRGSIQYRRNNFRGRAEAVTIGGFAGRLDQRADASWVNPNFWNGGWASTVTLSGERNSENPIFTSQLSTGGIQFQHYLDSKKTKSVYVRYNLSHTKLSNLLVPQLVLPQDQNVRLSTISGSYSRDTRDNVLDAHKGIYQSFEIGLNPSALGSNTNFARFLGQVAYYKPVFGNGTVWANSIRLGLEQAFAGAHIPLSESFFSGGGSTLRGFPLNGAGPQRLVPVCGNPADPSTCAQISVPVGGPQLLILNSELRFPLGLMKNLGGAAFYDGGNIFSKVGLGSFTSDYTNSVGLGLRYSTPVGPVRIDIGHLVNNIPGVKSTQLFITLGQAF